jgi:ankyrin repeat protein
MCSNKPLLLLLMSLLLSLILGSEPPETDGEGGEEHGIICDPLLLNPAEAILASKDPASTISRLRERGYDVNERDSEGLTVLMKAAERRLAKVVLAILAAGAATSLQSPRTAKYVGGWYCVEEIPEQTAAQMARRKGDNRLAVVIDNYKMILQVYLNSQHLLANSGKQQLDFTGLPPDIVREILYMMFTIL